MAVVTSFTNAGFLGFLRRNREVACDAAILLSLDRSKRKLQCLRTYCLIFATDADDTPPNLSICTYLDHGLDGQFDGIDAKS